MVRAATNSSRQDNFKNAATHLRRAHQIASKHASEGLLAGRVARATIGVQYCALLSHAGRHSQALNEALAAVVEAEEVWCLVRGSSEASTQLTRRSVCAVVQAKHCVAIELEYSLGHETSEVTAEAASVRERLIPSLHQEAADLAAQWLSPGHPVRELSERTEAQEASRRADTGAAGEPIHDPWGLNQLHVTDEEPRPETPPEIKDAPGLPAVVEIAEGSRGSRPTSAHSVLSRPTSAAKLQRLEDQALPPPAETRLPAPVAIADGPEERLPSRGSVLWDAARERVFSRGSSRGYRSRCGSKSGDRRRRGSSGEEGYDIFRAWAQKNLPKHVKGSVNQRIATEAGFLELKHEMKTQSRHFHMQEIPRFTPEDLYENKIFFTDYGVQVRSKAQRKEEKPAAPEGRSFSKRRAAHVNNLVSVKTLSDRLNESHANSQLAKEFFAYLYGSRKNKSMDIFESLRQAYKDSSKAA